VYQPWLLIDNYKKLYTGAMSQKEITNNEIMEALGQFANNVDERFGTMDKRFDAVDKHLFKIDGRLDNLETDMSEVKTKISHIESILDNHMKRIEEILQENQVQKYQQDRMERWIFQLADKLDIKLKYE
jgi:archaellum component FlaC